MNAAPRADWRLAIHASLPSTSDFCRERAAAGEPEGLAVLALRQTKGRGSRGRSWSSAPGSLSLSVLLRPVAPAGAAGEWALLAGVAMADGLARFLPDASGLALKWPNDILLHGRKLAGILIDSSAGEGGRLDWLVIGFGANLAKAPQLLERAAAALAEAGRAPPPELAARSVLDRLDHWRGVRLREGFAAVRAAWLRRSQPMGSRLRLRLHEGVADGCFAGLSEEGALLLQTAAGVRAYATGEVLSGDAEKSAVIG